MVSYSGLTYAEGFTSTGFESDFAVVTEILTPALFKTSIACKISSSVGSEVMSAAAPVKIPLVISDFFFRYF